VVAHGGETARSSLEQLLLSLFDADGLRHYLALGPEGEAVAADLPAGRSPRDSVHLAVDVLVRRGLVDVAFFDRLRGEFPARGPDVRAACARWIDSRPVGVPCPAIVGPDSGFAALGERLEDAFRRREDVIVGGGDSAQIDAEIRELRRELRRGAQLRPGESLLAGRYRLVEVLGRGGFATVWKAYDRETRELVAVKVLHGQWTDDRSRRERFLRGARGMMRLHHPAIVRVLREPVEDEGFWFYVMQRIDGPSLHQAVLAHGMKWSAALAVVLTVCDALVHAHAHKLVHRDVKPGNILLDPAGAGYLTDFDLLMADHTTGGTETGAGLGTLFYAAQEALSDASRVDARADVYSVGKTLMFCWLGRDLRASEVVGSQPDHESMPAGVRAVLARATDDELPRRYPTITALRDALLGLARTAEADAALQG
jgi:tRNA A-37 threonylcarbamoyl transferase component Bud32